MRKIIPAVSVRRKSLMGAAAIPVGAMLVPRLAWAVPSLSVFNLGTTATTSFTTSGWTSFLVTVTTDSGAVITAFDAGSTAAPTDGIFGTFLQRWVYNSNTGNNDFPTPTGTVNSNGTAPNSADSHLIIPSGTTTVAASAPNEDSNQTQPTGAPPSGVAFQFGTGTAIHGAVGISSPQTQVYQLAYMVLRNGTATSIALEVAEAPAGGGPSTAYHVATFFGEPPHNRVIALTAVADGEPFSFGNKLLQGTGVDRALFNPPIPKPDSINVTGPGNGVYAPGYANNINSGAGESKFYVEATGWNPGTDPEGFVLNVKVAGADPTPAQVTTIVNDINGNEQGVVASVVSGPLAALFPGYDILLTATAAADTASGGDEFLSADFSRETNIPGVVVTDIAAIPEPASVGVLGVGALALLARRRRMT